MNNRGLIIPKIKGNTIYFIHNLKEESGQSLVEFVLLLSVIVLLSFGFLKVANTGLAEYWLKAATLILDDPSQKLQMR